MDGRISPTPSRAPQPSGITPDRGGGETPSRGPAKGGLKRKKKLPAKPATGTPKDPKSPGSHVDIHALRIEMLDGLEWEFSSACSESKYTQEHLAACTSIAV